jgi:hypothetical protein
MSKIQKVAVYDARLQQDDPVYAVQKGALSVSVAPFQAISASQSQMTFQVLVPSLNVFVDRKIQLATPLSFTAQLFYGGPRALTHKDMYICTLSSAATVGSLQAPITATTFLRNQAAAAVVNVPIGSLVISPGLPPNTYTTSVITTSAAGTVTVPSAGVVYLSQPFVAAAASGSALLIIAPAVFDAPDPFAGQSGSADFGSTGQNTSDPFTPLGYASAVSGKDLAWCPFPIQSALANMTATLNDCTVTTNGDTLKEQIMLTCQQENVKQRTTPTSLDTYSWGRDDAASNSGNFSTYNVVNQYGDLPNGAWPTTWCADSACSTTLQSVTASLSTATNGSTNVWPFLPVGSCYNFIASTNTAMQSKTGYGFYIAQTASSVTGVTNALTLVPYVSHQPVWATAFPGGDLISNALGSATANTGLRTATSSLQCPWRWLTANTLVLNVAVPGVCMIGARVYDAGLGSYNSTGTVAAAQVANGPVVGIVTSCLTGALGAVGSTYGVTFAAVLTQAYSNATDTTVDNIWGLSAGSSVQLPQPVYGTAQFTEPLVISPLIWSDAAEFSTVGLYGMTNMQFVLNFSSISTTQAYLNPLGSTQLSIANSTTAAVGNSIPYWVDDMYQQNPNTGNILRSSSSRTVLSDMKYAIGSGSSSNGPWFSNAAGNATINVANPTLFATFLTPGPDVTLPALSTVPYVEFPRYFYSTSAPLTQNGISSIQSQTISLTSIPDMIMVYLKPATRAPSQLEQYIPISKASITFDNFSNLCSNFKQFNLYECSVASGLDMDWHQWRGYTQGAVPSQYVTGSANSALTYGQTGFTQLSGGPLLLRMGHDITLQPGLAPGCLGNFSLQVTLDFDNTKGYYNYLTNTVLTIVAINTGFFETVRGQSMIRKTILDAADVAAAVPDSGLSRSHLNRLIGRGGMGSFSNMVNKGMSAYRKAQEINSKHDLTGLARSAGYGGMADTAEMMLGQKRARGHMPSGL